MFFTELAAKPWQFRAQDAVSAEFKEQLEELDENCTEAVQYRNTTQDKELSNWGREQSTGGITDTSLYFSLIICLGPLGQSSDFPWSHQGVKSHFVKIFLQ